LPKNATGKVQRRALKEMAVSQPDLAEQGVVARV
jgi:acyl-coenzyme A synthetase/AMP-(fatty) acid ligase